VTTRTFERVRNGISVDLEDWFSLVRRRLWEVEEPPTERVVVATRQLLDLLDEARTKATFFVLGSVADAFPDLVREVRDRGHEIGTHGYAHRRLDAIGADRFRQELRTSRDAIERACGTRPVGHRAPEFSVTNATPWAFEVMESEGLTFDSSVFPIRHRRYGIPGAPVSPYTIGQLRELPLATLIVGGRRIPAAGGGYLRYFPYAVIEGAVRQANRRGDPAVIYVHPYEFDPEPLRFAEAAPTARGRLFIAMQNAFRARVPSRLSRLLRAFPFGPLGELA
jgi:polysaccharide deacetylase family protein (PEP-CTERM system associated)